MMDRFVVDASVVMSWCFDDETNDYADAVLDLLHHGTAMVPPIWPLEVANVLLAAERKKRLQESDSSRFINLLSQLPIVVVETAFHERMAEFMDLARENGLSSYDASYLDLAMREGIPLATLDEKLLRAAHNVKVGTLDA